MITTQMNIEITDTFNGEANYSWVTRESFNFPEGIDISDLTAIRKAKKLMGWNGLKCKKEDYGDQICLRPSNGASVVMFISFHCFGICGGAI